MRLLLDTHAFIWFDGEPSRLSPEAKAACQDPANELALSVASVWEMQIKVMLGKLILREPLRQLITDQIQQNGLLILPVKLEHVFHLDLLPAHHKDPFDRLIIAQAAIEGWRVVSHDSTVVKYPIQVVW